MIRTKELYEMTQPVSPQEQKEWKDYNNNYHLALPEFSDDDDNTDYFREIEEDMFNERFTSHFEDRY